MVQKILLLATLLVKIMSAQRIPAYPRSMISETIVESSQINPPRCRDLSAAIQDFVLKNLRTNTYKTPIFGPMSGPFVDEIESTLRSYPRFSSVNVLPKAFAANGGILKTATKVCSCGSCAQGMLNSATVNNCARGGQQALILKSATPNSCSCNSPNCGCGSATLNNVAPKNCACGGQPVLKTATPENCRCGATRVINNVATKNCACGAPNSCSCNAQQSSPSNAVNTNVFSSLMQSGLLKVAPPCGASTVLNTANSCSCGSPILKSLNPKVYASLLNSGLLTPACSCAISSNGLVNCDRCSKASSPVVLNEANNVYTVSNGYGCRCGRGML